MRRFIFAAALCMASEAVLAQYSAYQTSNVGTGKTFCSRYEAALMIANRIGGQPYQRPPAGCFVVAPNVPVMILQSYSKLPTGGAIWQVQLGNATGFLAFSLAPSAPPVAAANQPAAKVAPFQPGPSGSAPAATPSKGTFATSSLSPESISGEAPFAADKAKRPTDVAAIASPEKSAPASRLPRTEATLAPPAATLDFLKTAPGMPLCIDQDSLATFLVAGLLAVNGKITRAEAAESVSGCETIADGSRAEVIERYASGSSFMRIVKVRVTSRRLRGPTVGYTVEIDE
jgi:hypothetical protein